MPDTPFKKTSLKKTSLKKPLKKTSLKKYGNRALRDYGTTVLKERAIPSLYDGLKPVQRRILWSMHGLRLFPGSRPVKASRVIGRTMGLYHPHGDSSIESAMHKLVNSPVPFIDGCGSNWGTITSKPGASRYIECRLSAWTSTTFLDDIHATCPMIPNYDDQREEPLWLPAKTMAVLINGSSGIAVGSTTDIPSFTEKSVNTMLERFLKKELSVDDIVDILVFSRMYGGEVSGQREAFRTLVATGKGKITFSPVYTVKGKTAIITGIPMPLQSGKTAEKISMHPDVDVFIDQCTYENPVRFIIKLKDRIALKDVAKKLETVTGFLKYSKTYRLTYLKESIVDGKPKIDFHESGMIPMIEGWIEWRQHLERKTIDSCISKLSVELEKLEFHKKIGENLDVVDECRHKPKPEKYLESRLDLTPDESDRVMGMSVRQLSRIHLKNVGNRIKEIGKELKSLESQKNTKSLNKRIISALKT